MDSSSSPSSPSPASSSNDAKTWAMLCHLSALAGFIIPVGNIIGPLIVWQIKKTEFPQVDDQGKESLNFQITVLLAAIVSFVLMFVVIGIFLLAAVGIANLVFIIIATLRANQGELYKYPFNLRLIK
ncbi:MAG TPA: DUF4870 domain-containing protein [Opitutaceae bacterium]|jgi:uncharacterized Tic20 family protein|nr:DUF4870 domain-containing protein [Opitutaceae bacterium]